MKKCTAIVLSAGQGTRMGTKIQKQYLQINQKPVVFYSLDDDHVKQIFDQGLSHINEG